MNFLAFAYITQQVAFHMHAKCSCSAHEQDLCTERILQSHLVARTLPTQGRTLNGTYNGYFFEYDTTDV